MTVGREGGPSKTDIEKDVRGHDDWETAAGETRPLLCGINRWRMDSFLPQITRAGTNVPAQNNTPRHPNAEVQAWKERRGGDGGTNRQKGYTCSANVQKVS